ncbi:Amastin surface glycofamily protein [Leishmania donovani]|uniref:Amastin surface glycofamily protein n=1 Tax=Leishmania donovani TaxID=5661 RepID=A0A504XDB4_LEIDO|nr:Amastin surface glycofamily protein [Leishmania donovani]
MLYCWSFVRWVCLTLNIVGLCSVGITWGAMLVAYVRDEGFFCRALKLNYQLSVGFFLLLVAWVLDLVDIVFLLLPFQAQRSADAARQLRDDALVEEPAELILPCEESLPLATGFGGVVRLGARHGMQAEHRDLKGPDPRLASILPEVVRHSPRPPPVTHTTDVTASALEQEPGRAARLGRGMRSTRVRVAPTAQHVPEGGDEQGQDEPVRRMARLKGRQCVLGDQDVAVAQQRPPSPGLRHGAVAEVMGNATWPLVVGTDGGELCVAPERIVLRGPPRKLHHTARLLERASWPRCCAHGPRAVEAVALIPISRALCRSAVRVEGGPLAHVGVRGAEGRLRCVVEALCVKRGREVCGDAVALACATVVCAISPMAAAGVRRLGLRMIATQHAVDELFAAVHECRVSAGRRTDEKLLRSVRRWGRTALHDPAQDVCVFHHKLFHSASRCCWPQARAFRREVSKMGCKFTFLVYAILQLIAFLSVLIGTPLDMFRGDLNDFGERPCVTLWGFKRRCYSIVYALDTDEKWATCHKRRSRFRMAEALAAISIMVYCAAFVLGVIMLFCCSLLRWVCLTLNVVGLLTLGITWVFMVLAYVQEDGVLCPALRTDYKFGYGFFLLLVAWVLDLVDIVFLLIPVHRKNSVEAARQLRDDALVEEPAELILPCEESLPLATGFGGVVRLGARHGMQAEHRDLKGPDPRLASILPEVVRHSPRPPPVTHTTDVTASALEQEPGRAARLGRGMRSTRVRVAPTAQHVPEGGDEQGQDEPVRRMARLKGRQCVLGDQDVAVAQQRPPSPGLRHGAVAEVMGNATWPLVVGTDGGELCVAPERIVLRGPPRKLHHTARLLERASWPRCCAHGPRAVEAVALIPISRALCRSAVRVEGGPLAHVGVRGAEGRLRCVVEALCVKRGREVCGDAVALACATVVCAISPMAAAGVRRLGLRMIATQHAVDELFAAVHECRVSAGRRTDEKLLRSVRRWGRTALHDPAQDVCVFHHKLFHSASRCCWPQARAFRREVSKMGCKFTFLVYAILQLIAFLSVLIGTPLDMFRGDLNDFGERPCVTLWGFKRRCYSIVYALDTDEKWATCHKRRSRFRMAEALAAISIMVYCAAFVLGVIMLFCCSLLRWVCLTLNVVGLLTLGITWVFMVLAYVQEDGVLCPALRTDYKFGYGFFLLLVAWVLDLVDIVFLLIPVHRKNSVEAARQLRDDALVEEPAELILPCEESLPLATGFGGVVRLGARHGMQAEHRDLKGPDPRLASILPEVVRHSPRPPPVTHTTDVTASALEQDPGRAARLAEACHVPEGGDEQGQDEPVRRMARLKGRQCVLGDQDVAVAQQRPPSPGLRHGAVAEVMGNATWPLVVGTDGGELCVAPERIVLRGPPRKLHHTARLLERASWPRCCAHGPRAVEAVALIPISRALCRSAVRVEGGPLAHVGVRGAEGRLRCVVEALCVKRGREVCGDAVALACATVVCAISPRLEAASSVTSCLDSIPAVSLITEQLIISPNTPALNPSPLCRPREGRQQQPHLQSSIEAKSPFGVHNDVNVTDMGLGFSGCSQQSSPREAAAQRTSIEGHRDASRCISNSTKLHLTAPGPEVDDAHWVFQRPPNNQRTFYFQEDNLEFSSQFDSGNLIQVERVGVFHYRMYTAMDCGNAPWQTNNRQWFHFSVRGGSKGAVVTICFVGMAHSNMFTYDWMPVMAVVPTRPQYTRIAGKAHVEALEKMPETPGYPLLVHKPVSKDDADSDGGGDEGDNDADAGAAGANNNGGAGGIAFSISPTGRSSGTSKKKKTKKKSIAMNLTFNFKIETEIAVTYTPPQGRPDSPAIYIASNHPYTYYTLQRNLAMWQETARRSNTLREMSLQAPDHQARRSSSEQRSGPDSYAVDGLATFSEIYFHREVLCKSLEGRDVTLLTISDCSRMAIERAPLLSKEDGLPHSSALGFTQRPYSFFGKQYVVLTARVHPGECPGSHLMHGCIDFLMNCTDCRAAALRHNFVFCVVPMLNPDGVVRGHSRVDSNGVDLNRMYRDPSRKRHPAPYAVLALLRSLGSRVALFIDMHAHANKRGTFFYGNSMDWANQIENLLYAKLVSLNTPYLDFRSCNFSEANMFAVSKSGKRKDSSSRVVAFTEAGIVHGYTIETSHVMADALNPVALLTNHQTDQLDTALPSPPPVMHSPATFRDTARAMLLGLLDLKGINPKSRLPLTQFHSTRGLALWLQRQLQIESAETLFAQAFKLHGKEAQASTSESGNTLLATIMKSMAAEEYPEKITIREARLLPRTTFSGVRSFVPLDTAIVLLSQTVPTGPPRSLLYGSGNCGAASGAAAAGGTGSKGGGSAQRRGTSPSFSGNNCTTAIPPAVIATRRRSKPMLLSSDTTVET